MAQAVVVKKEEKVGNVFDAMTDIGNRQEFKDKFKTMYPDDWRRIIAKFEKEERQDTKHKGHPMPHPEKYLDNMYNVGLKKRQ